jgi:hypothetical protein
MKLVFDRHDEVAEWVSERIGTLIPKPYVAIGATRDGKTLCGGAVFNNYNTSNVDIILASDRCLTRGTIRGILHYCFIQSNVNRVTAATRRSNKLMRKILPRFGFEFEGVAKQYYGSSKKDDAFVFALFRDRAEKWLR